MRIRTIKPEFWSHPVLARQPDAVRLMAIGLLTYADDEGYFSSDETLVRNSLRPFDKDSGNSLESLRSLSEVGFIELCEHPSRGPIGRVVNFAKHQKISHPTRSRLAAYWYQENIQKHSGVIPEPLRPDLGIRVSGYQGIRVSREQGAGIEVVSISKEPIIDPAEQNIFAPSSDPKTRPMIDRVRAIPGLQKLPKDMEALVASANAYGIENLTAAVDECNRSGQKAYENIVTPIAARMKHEQENPSSQYGKEGPSLPDNLNDLPIGHPLRIFLRKAQVAE